ncbi:FtsX-like permease family protein [Hamadaea tsunoensis]|uniref:FtsX-like permease family protein n=1 Tax=Hamadaea tsunoensis TaxID=53368 RepID=UPI00040DF1B2|nr:FtsX-like permease family protein [Hamadaea tsunoensis]
MSRLLVAMVRERLGAVLTVLALSAIAAAGAVAGPLYRTAASTAATSAEVAQAAPVERSITRDALVSRQDRGFGPPRLTGEIAPQLPYREGFDTIGGLQVAGRVMSAAHPTPADQASTPAWFVYRNHVCEHVRVVAGRCVAGAGEAIVADTVAKALGLDVGDLVDFQAGNVGHPAGFNDDGPPTRLTVVGRYDLGDLASAYGAGRTFAGGVRPDDDGSDDGLAVFATLETVSASPFSTAVQTTDLVARDATFADLDYVRYVAQDEADLAEENGYAANTSMADLAARIEANRSVLDRSIQVAALPLVLLTLVVLYLAVTAGVLRRRSEFGLSGLRGVPGGTRWWIASAEYLLPAVLGAPIGLLTGLLLVRILSARALPGAPSVHLTVQALVYAAIAVAAVAVLSSVAQWRAARGPVADLMRRTPARRRAVVAGLGEVFVVLLTVAAGYQITADAHPSGVALLTPVLVAVATGLVARRIVALLAERAGRAGLRRGRLNAAMFALSVARRPSLARLLTLLVVLFGVVGFAVAATATGADARAERARLDVGAPEVLQVRPLTAAELLKAVRAADPTGKYAMAAYRLRDQRFPALAVDSPRLASVGFWSQDATVSLRQAAELLHPSASPGSTLPMIGVSQPRERVQATADSVGVELAGQVPALPRLGGAGGLVDMEYLGALVSTASPVREPQVWLAADAPAGLRDALRSQGLDVIGDVTAAARTRELDRSGPALALRFYLVVSLTAILLGLGALLVAAAAESEEQRRMMRALRVQGLPARAVLAQSFGGYALLTLAAAIAGTGASALAWWVARAVVPFFADSGYAPRTPALLPRADLVGVTTAAAAVLLLVTSAITVAALRRAVERSPQ